MIKRIFFDFGGCLDAPGIHTRTLFWDAFLAEGLRRPEERAAFQEAYSQADKRMMTTGEAKELNLKDFNRLNAILIAEFLELDGASALHCGDRVTELMRGYLENSRRALLPFQKSFELGVISNFTGNLEVILRDFQLRDFFDSVTESFYAGASKPDKKIFLAALATQKCAPENCLYVGDNPVNDIAPARELGMGTALIHPPGQRKDCGADFYIEDLDSLLPLIQRV